MEKQSNHTFHGQQEGEKLLSTITPHHSSLFFEYVKIFLVSIFLLVGFSSLNVVSPVFTVIGILLSIVVFIIGFQVNRTMHSKRIAYITNRRIVRFESSNALVVNSRSLTWDNVIKVKTFSTSMFWRLKNVGTVIIHSRTSSTNTNNSNQIFIANDDIVLKNVHYYKDLGNYIDKILYLHSNDQKQLDDIHAFANKPKGQRY